jgi:plasmid stability protein
MFSKISIRNIPQHIFSALEALATHHDRSTEAEARQAIQSWVEPSMVKDERSVRRKEVAERLSRLLQQVNAEKHIQRVRPSHVAQSIGEDRAEEVEDWFLGLKEPTFTQLEAIADLFGIEKKWLQHGDGRIYPVKTERLPQDPESAVQWLTTWESVEPTEDKVKRLHLIREMDENGMLHIVKESERGHFRIYSTPTHVSDRIGSGGEAMLTHLFVTLELLYKRYTKGGAGFSVVGHQLKPDDVTLLNNGNTNPGALLRDNNVSMWWEDIWDKAMVEKQAYWPGWRALCESIERAIAANKHLNDIRNKIRSGELR